ncbi:MAG: DNA mismatch repair endonuclease MutL, partial [Candidatus Eremiobacteraeota bacterium]|nr:DNA mismatch repair endonuclease MutL [Candidatus Eremiobacteraeota bacterium]
MSVIHVLEKSVAERIAAGEVIERPVSVVKELVENSIDAGASRIQVEIKGGGLQMIRVADDGCGISREDLPVAIRRFATSKIKNLEDIDNLYTLGFRGEALPSITAVSRVEIITRRDKDEEGSRIVIMGGEIMEEGGIGAPPGTVVEVRELFFNTPARRKFMKSASAEGARIIDWLQKIALYHTGIDFQLVSNGRRVLMIPPQMDQRERLGNLFNVDPEDFIPLDYSGKDLSVRGFIGKPGLARKDRARQVIFVRGRLIRHPVITKALSAGADPLIEGGHYPSALLFIDVSRGLDVNVHPTKSEVRFSDNQAIFNAVHNAVRDAYRAYGIKEIKVNQEPGGLHVSQAQGLYEKVVVDSFEQIPPTLDLFSQAGAPDKDQPSVVWQLGATYIIGIKEGDLWIIDQHAAAERLTYNKLRYSIKN